METVYYVLKRASVASKIDRGSSSCHLSRPVNIPVSAGSLWQQTYESSSTTGHSDALNEPVAARNSSTAVALRSCEIDDLQMKCWPHEIHRLNGDAERQLLEAVDTSERLRLVETDAGVGQLRDGCRMLAKWNDEGNAISALEPNVSVGGLARDAAGLVRYIGRLSGRNGVWFGVELSPQYHGLGTSDGSVDRKHYFDCEERCGVFVAVNQISLFDQLQNHRHHFSDERAHLPHSVGVPSSKDSCDPASLPRPPLENGERVVWISDTGPELGTVRWIGILPDSRIMEYTIGVEFDNAIGTGTGKYRNKQLFRARQNHASLIPVLGLMKAEEYYGSASHVPPAPFSVPSGDSLLSTVIVKSAHYAPRNSGKLESTSTFSSRLDNGDERFVPQDGLSTGVSRICENEVLVHGEDVVEQSPAIEYDRSSSSKSTSTTSRAGKAAELYTAVAHQGLLHPVPAECRQTDAPVSERSIYDTTLEHCYANVEKDESGRLLNRDTLAFRMSDYETDKSAAPLAQANGQVGVPNLIETSTSHDRCCDVPVIIHRIKKSDDAIFTNSLNHSSGIDRVQSDTVTSTTDQVPYHTGRSIFYQRVDSNEGCLAPDASTSSSTIDSSPNNNMSRRHRSVFVSPGSSPTRYGISNVSNTYQRTLASGCSPVDGTTAATFPIDLTEATKKSRTLPLHTDKFLAESNVPRGGTSADGDMATSGVTPKALSRDELTNTDLDIGSVVEFDIGSERHYGVIRWIGYLSNKRHVIVGIELEEESKEGGDGVLGYTRLFECAPHKGFFTGLHNVCKDSRFAESSQFIRRNPNLMFGNIECIDVPGCVLPPAFNQKFLGQNRGIQGHQNSCYMDATLFSMFAFSMVFDSILHRPHRPNCNSNYYDKVQRTLREGIVNPLRKNFYVRADKVFHLRHLLDKSSSVQGLMSEEKDPEEFLNSLLQQTLKADPLIHLSSGHDTYFYQLFMDKDDRVLLPTTQQLLELSFMQSDVKLSEIPSCLILQMPRFGKVYKMFKRIVPSLYLDITDILMYGIRECAICGAMATYECKNCFREFGDGLDKISFCDICLTKSHSRNKRSGHQPVHLPEKSEYKRFAVASAASQHSERQAANVIDLEPLREKMELFAVICIETSHYVAFVKSGSDRQSPWVFFDSMADRKGEEHGYNIPSVERCPQLPTWLENESYEEIRRLHDDRDLPEQMRRLLCDAYICMYTSCSLSAYR